MIYLVIDRGFGLLSNKVGGLPNNLLWNVAFYIYIFLGGIALLIGWLQFNKKWRSKNMKLHRMIGKIYVVAVLISGITSIHIGFYVIGGFVSALGFISLGLIWFYTTVMGYVHIRQGKVMEHRLMMIYSYADCFSAVTLRLWLPILVAVSGNFEKGYVLAAWICWVPNIIVAYWLVRNMQQRELAS